MLISHFNLVNAVEPEAEPSPNKTEPAEVLSLESLFDQESLPADAVPAADESSNATSPTVVAEGRQPDVMSMIELNSLTGEILFKKVVDYEELTNKVLSIGRRRRVQHNFSPDCR